MHDEILSASQRELLPLMERFRREYYLVGGTAMKAYALGRRSKWKDYVDLYFLLEHQFSIEDISGRASELFGPLFSEKQFRAQLAFFDDIDYSETVDYLIDPAPSAEEIKAKLTEISLMGI